MTDAKTRNARHDDVPPLIDENCDKLVLGSMLSPKSAQAKFYYAHPQNRFWRVLYSLFGQDYSDDNTARAKFALSHGIALWDVIESCEIVGAADSTIKNATYNSIAELLQAYPKISRIFTTGGAAAKHLKAYGKTLFPSCPQTIIAAVALPSTSPLNCKASLTDLVTAYSVLKN